MRSLSLSPYDLLTGLALGLSIRGRFAGPWVGPTEVSRDRTSIIN